LQVRKLLSWQKHNARSKEEAGCTLNNLHDAWSIPKRYDAQPAGENQKYGLRNENNTGLRKCAYMQTKPCLKHAANVHLDLPPRTTSGSVSKTPGLLHEMKPLGLHVGSTLRRSGDSQPKCPQNPCKRCCVCKGPVF
jgi:hypothetical protein